MNAFTGRVMIKQILPEGRRHPSRPMVACLDDGLLVGIRTPGPTGYRVQINKVFAEAWLVIEATEEDFARLRKAGYDRITDARKGNT